MKKHLPSSYFEGIQLARDNTDIRIPEFEELHRLLRMNSFSPSLNPSRYYIVDYIQKKYLYLDPSCATYLGYRREYIQDAGPLFYTSLWNKKDFKIYNDDIFPESLKFLKQHRSDDHNRLFINLNYRIKDRSGNHLTLLQRSTVITSQDGFPLLSIGMVSNMNSHLTGNRM